MQQHGEAKAPRREHAAGGASVKSSADSGTTGVSDCRTGCDPIPSSVEPQHQDGRPSQRLHPKDDRMRTAFGFWPSASICLAGAAYASHDESRRRALRATARHRRRQLPRSPRAVRLDSLCARAGRARQHRQGRQRHLRFERHRPRDLLHGPVHATGGYDELDHFLESRPLQVRSIVTGVDARYQARARGARLLLGRERRGRASAASSRSTGPALQAVSAAAAAVHARRRPARSRAATSIFSRRFRSRSSRAGPSPRRTSGASST